MSRRSGTANPKSFIAVLVTVVVIISVIALLRYDATGRKGSGLNNKFTYDINELAKVDPNLIIYKESAQPFDTGLTKSHNIAIDSESSIYICGDKAIRIFTPQGDLAKEIIVADTPWCMAPTKDGRIFVGFEDHIEIYDAQGQQLASWENPGENAILTSIATSNNNVFVADAGNRIVIRYDTNGNIINRIGQKDADRNVPGFVIPSPYFDLAISRDGLLRVVSPGRLRIEAYTFEGDFEFAWGEPSMAIEDFCGCCNPVNIAVLPEGGFVTCEKGLIRVKIYDSDGGFVGVVAGPDQLARDIERKICLLPEECQEGGFDVAVNADGRIFVLDTIKNKVRSFDKIED